MNKKNTEFVKPGGLDLKDRLVSIQRVTKVTKGGRAFGFSAIVVVGDENGVVGHGLGKAKEVSIAISKAVEDAKKNLVRIPLYNSTIPHQQKGKQRCEKSKDNMCLPPTAPQRPRTCWKSTL